MSDATTIDVVAGDAAAPNAAPSGASGVHVLQREEVDALVRGIDYDGGPDPRGIALATEAIGRLVHEHPSRVLGWRFARGEHTVVVGTADLVEVATWMRDVAGFQLLSEVVPCDWLGHDEQPARFSVSYDLLKLVPGAPRVRLQVWVDEGADGAAPQVPSVMGVYPTADWHEREGFDFFGIEFTGREGLRRILMDDDWVGHPARKDYPMGGEPVKFTNSLREL
jgi:NADH:ubiquinone oxidoreductase subunit C